MHPKGAKRDHTWPTVTSGLVPDGEGYTCQNFDNWLRHRGSSLLLLTVELGRKVALPEPELLRLIRDHTRSSWVAKIRKEGLDRDVYILPCYYRAVYGRTWGQLNGPDATPRYRSFEEARKFARSLKLPSWEAWTRIENLPHDVPRTPYRIYRGRGWISCSDWVGKPKRPEYRSFEQAKQFVRRLGLATRRAWEEYSRSGRKPDDIPTCPDHVYQDQWAGLADWLGVVEAPQVRTYRPFEEARRLARQFGLRTRDEWLEYARSRKKPADIPICPESVYAGQWRGMADWLGRPPRPNEKAAPRSRVAVESPRA